MGKVNENYKVTNSSDDQWRFVWIVDFPLFEMENGYIQSVHHPFTQPQTKITPSNLLEVCLTKYYNTLLFCKYKQIKSVLCVF